MITYLILCLVAAATRLVPLFFGSESWDIVLYRYQAIPVLEGINPYLYHMPAVLTNIRQPFVYLPFSLFYAPAAFQMAVFLQAPFHVVIKLAPILFDMGILAALVLYVYRTDRDKAVRIGWLYALNPIAILTASFHGNVMAGPVLLTLLALTVYKDEKKLSGLFLGLAIAWRHYPILLLPAFLLKCPDRRSAWRFLIAAAAPSVVTALPFIVADPAAMLRAIGYTGIVGSLGWHVIADSAFRIFAGSPLLPDSTDPAVFLSSGFNRAGMGLFLAAYASLLVFGRKKLSLLQLILSIFLSLYLLSATVAQQYLVWVIPFLALWSFTAAAVFTAAAGAAMVVRYWSLYPEILFGAFPAVPLPPLAKSWASLITVSVYWLAVAALLVRICTQPRTIETAPVNANSKRTFKPSLPAASRTGGWVRLVTHSIVILLAFLFVIESLFLLKLHKHDPWDVVRRITVEASAGGDGVVPAAAFSGDTFYWSAGGGTVKRYGKDGAVKPELRLTHPDTGKALDIYDMTALADGSLIVADWRSGFLGRFDGKGGLIKRFTDHIRAPIRVATCGRGKLAVLDVGTGSALVFAEDGRLESAYRYPFGGGRIPIDSYDIGIDAAGKVYVLDGGSQRVSIIDTKPGPEKNVPVACYTRRVKLSVTPEGEFFVVGVDSDQISLYAPEGGLIARIENAPGDKAGPLDKPFAVMTDEANNIFIADAAKAHILQVKFRTG